MSEGDHAETGQRSHKGPALLSKLLGRDGRERHREERARLRAQVERSEE